MASARALKNVARVLPLIVGLTLCRAERLHSQDRFFHFGLTESFGWERTACDFDVVVGPNGSVIPQTCNPGRAPSDGFPFFTGGISWVTTPRSGPTLQAGAIFTLKGWGGSGGTEWSRPYLELPVLVGVGRWPERPHVGCAFTFGVAPDLNIPNLDRSDLAILVGPELRGLTATGSKWSLGFRYSHGLRDMDGTARLAALTMIFGYSPGSRPK